MTAVNLEANIRKQMRQKRSSLDKNTQLQAAKNTFHLMQQHPEFLKSNNIGFYIAQEGELDPEPLLKEALKRGKKVYLPALHPTKDKELTFLRYLDNDKLEKNRHGILQPNPFSSLITPWKLDLVIVPTVAFDHSGNRLGRGAGYYDRCFSFIFELPDSPQPTLIGYAYKMQQLEKIEKKPWDVPLKYIATEQEVIKSKHS